ncbi:hypothetical protein SeLEV6574_g06258 [Synchytrium endobioticum]|uniref:Uncharacterized protein n=1 Tax=Synchytrium endobioticum TaxID=286115 RepID=A0A507CPM6_9FUNG|nr:hypothetical protein SeLEV6574_g06258 [Synchytrium endobioticum]
MLRPPQRPPKMHPTPTITHISTHSEYKLHVYDPAEDTFLLMDALEQDVSCITSTRPAICLEIGSGSGCVITFLATLIGSECLFLATDINPVAARATVETSRVNNVHVDVLNTRFTRGLSLLPFRRIDVLLFNPPYVVTPDETELPSESAIEAAWAGGKDGRVVIDEFLELVPTILSLRGICYMVCIRENKPDEIKNVARSKGLDTLIVQSRRAGREHLYVLKFAHARTASGDGRT